MQQKSYEGDSKAKQPLYQSYSMSYMLQIIGEARL